jgi:hypothetical protein
MAKAKDPFEKNNLFNLAHCMLCKNNENLKVIGHHRDGLIVGFFFVCKECLDIVRNGDLQWQLIPCEKGLEILKGG